jgi:hypothetical protein
VASQVRLDYLVEREEVKDPEQAISSYYMNTDTKRMIRYADEVIKLKHAYKSVSPPNPAHQRLRESILRGDILNI